MGCARWPPWTPISPPRAARRAAAAPGDKAGRLLPRRLNPATVGHILKAQLGVGASGFSAHSLRAGFITAAAQGGAPEHAIQAHSRHKSVGTLRL